MSLQSDPLVSSDARNDTEAKTYFLLPQRIPELPEALALVGSSFYVQPIVSLAGHVTSVASPPSEVGRSYPCPLRHAADAFAPQITFWSRGHSSDAATKRHCCCSPAPSHAAPAWASVASISCDPIFFACLPVQGRIVKFEPDVSGHSSLRVLMPN